MTQKFSKLFSILALLSLTALFVISCSNEDTTGSGSGSGGGLEDISGLPDATTSELASYVGRWTGSLTLTSGDDIATDKAMSFTIEANNIKVYDGSYTYTLKKQSDTVFKAKNTYDSSTGLSGGELWTITFTDTANATLEYKILMESGGQSMSGTYSGSYTKSTT